MSLDQAKSVLSRYAKLEAALDEALLNEDFATVSSASPELEDLATAKAVAQQVVNTVA